MQKLLDVILGREREIPEVPVCPEHKVEMHLRGKLGKPTRFAAQTEEEYTLIYFCPRPDCNQTDTRIRARTQVPVPNEPPDRPDFARSREEVIVQ